MGVLVPACNHLGKTESGFLLCYYSLDTANSGRHQWRRSTYDQVIVPGGVRTRKDNRVALGPMTHTAIRLRAVRLELDRRRVAKAPRRLKTQALNVPLRRLATAPPVTRAVLAALRLRQRDRPPTSDPGKVRRNRRLSTSSFLNTAATAIRTIRAVSAKRPRGKRHSSRLALCSFAAYSQSVPTPYGSREL